MAEILCRDCLSNYFVRDPEINTGFYYSRCPECINIYENSSDDEMSVEHDNTTSAMSVCSICKSSHNDYEFFPPKVDIRSTDATCPICYVNEGNDLGISSCGHYGICNECLKNESLKKCPICRESRTKKEYICDKINEDNYNFGMTNKMMRRSDQIIFSDILPSDFDTSQYYDDNNYYDDNYYDEDEYDYHSANADVEEQQALFDSFMKCNISDF